MNVTVNKLSKELLFLTKGISRDSTFRTILEENNPLLTNPNGYFAYKLFQLTLKCWWPWGLTANPNIFSCNHLTEILLSANVTKTQTDGEMFFSEFYHRTILQKSWDQGKNKRMHLPTVPNSRVNSLTQIHIEDVIHYFASTEQINHGIAATVPSGMAIRV